MSELLITMQIAFGKPSYLLQFSTDNHTHEIELKKEPWVAPFYGARLDHDGITQLYWFLSKIMVDECSIFADAPRVVTDTIFNKEEQDNGKSNVE